MMPALLISMSSDSTWLAAAWICAALVTSSLSGVTRSSGWASGWRAQAYTRLAPLARASAASACPMPRLAPVTRTTLSSTVMPVAPVVSVATASQIGSGRQPLFEGLRSRCQRPGGGEIGPKRRRVGEPLEHRSLVGVGTEHFDRQRFVSGGDVVTALVGLGDLLAGQLVARDADHVALGVGVPCGQPQRRAPAEDGGLVG